MALATENIVIILNSNAQKKTATLNQNQNSKHSKKTRIELLPHISSVLSLYLEGKISVAVPRKKVAKREH